jgi:deoxyribose-phosphate aldolase
MTIAGRIDHTLLKPEATLAQITQTAQEALQHGFASVCVTGAWVPTVAKILAGSNVKTCAVAGFPLGANKPTIKAIEAASVVKDGAQEVDFVAFLPSLMAKDLGAAKTEYMEVVRAARAANRHVVIKLIIESAFLMKDVSADEAEARIACACQAARESGLDFVKTSTGFHGAGGATALAVSLMKKHGQGLYVKASGGIKNAQDAKTMIDAGADRLGCSAGIAIIQGLSSNASY